MNYSEIMNGSVVMDGLAKRIKAQGIAVATDAELLTCVIGKTLDKETLEGLLSRIDTLDELKYDGLHNCGLTERKKLAILSALELGRRYLTPNGRPQVKTPEDVYTAIRHYASRRQEYFLVVNLNGAHEIISTVVASIGLVNRTLVHPREVFSHAIAQCATAIIIAHNHPSGNLQASPEDLEVTSRIKQAGQILGIQVLDHIIFGESGWYSLVEGGEF